MADGEFCDLTKKKGKRCSDEGRYYTMLKSFILGTCGLIALTVRRSFEN